MTLMFADEVQGNATPGNTFQEDLWYKNGGCKFAVKDLSIISRSGFISTDVTGRREHHSLPSTSILYYTPFLSQVSTFLEYYIP
jgi:hypothetical protein